MSEWFLSSAKWVIFRLYHDENKPHSMKWCPICTVTETNILSYLDFYRASLLKQHSANDMNGHLYFKRTFHDMNGHLYFKYTFHDNDMLATRTLNAPFTTMKWMATRTLNAHFTKMTWMATRTLNEHFTKMTGMTTHTSNAPFTRTTWSAIHILNFHNNDMNGH